MANKTQQILSARHIREYRQYVRQQADAKPCRRIDIVDGCKAPEVVGDSGHYENASGDVIRHPNAYRRAFGRPIYCASTIRVEVGRDWLAVKRIPTQAIVQP